MKDIFTTSIFGIVKRTSLVLRAIKRFQISIHMDRYRLPSTDDLRSVFLPVFWYEEAIQIDEETASNFNIFTTIHISLGLLAITGTLLLIIGSVFIAYHFKGDKDLTVTQQFLIFTIYCDSSWFLFLYQ